MKFNITSVVLTGGGTLLLYGAIKDRNPIDLIKVVLQGKGPEAAKKISTGKPDKESTKDPNAGSVGPKPDPNMPGYVPKEKTGGTAPRPPGGDFNPDGTVNA